MTRQEIAMLEAWRAQLRSAVQASGLTPRQIAERTTLSCAVIRGVIDGTTKRPALDVIAAIAHAVGASVGALVGERAARLAPGDVRHVQAFTVFLDGFIKRAEGTAARSTAEAAHDDCDALEPYEAFLRGEEERGAAVRVSEGTMVPALYPGDVVRIEKRVPEEGDVVCAQVAGRHVFGYLAGDVLEPLHGPPIPRRDIQHVLGVATAVIDRDLTVPRNRA